MEKDQTVLLCNVLRTICEHLHEMYTLNSFVVSTRLKKLISRETLIFIRLFWIIEKINFLIFQIEKVMSGKKDPREQDPLDPENDLFWDPDLLRQPPPPPPPPTSQEYFHTRPFLNKNL